MPVRSTGVEQRVAANSRHLVRAFKKTPAAKKRINRTIFCLLNRVAPSYWLDRDSTGHFAPSAQKVVLGSSESGAFSHRASCLNLTLSRLMNVKNITSIRNTNKCYALIISQYIASNAHQSTKTWHKARKVILVPASAELGIIAIRLHSHCENETLLSPQQRLFQVVRSTVNIFPSADINYIIPLDTVVICTRAFLFTSANKRHVFKATNLPSANLENFSFQKHRSLFRHT
jgi:hypothetical protein